MTRLIRKVEHLELYGLGPEPLGRPHMLYEVIDTSTPDHWSRLFDNLTDAYHLVHSGAHINADGTITTPDGGAADRERRQLGELYDAGKTMLP